MASQTLMSQLEQLSPKMVQLMQMSGAPGLSLGVIHQGKRIYTNHFGTSGATKDGHEVPSDDDTLYYVASLSKLVTASIIANLVFQGLLDWDTPIRRYLPDFQRDDDFGQKATVVDLLANRTGLAAAAIFFGHMNGEFLTNKDDIVRRTNYIDAAMPFRKGFIYSSFNYALLSILIERLTKKSLDECAKDMIFHPLKMTRSCVDFSQKHNSVKQYAISHDLTACEIPLVDWPKSGFAAAAGVRSSLRELMIFYQSLMSAYGHQTATVTDCTPGSPFKYLRRILSPHIAVGKEDMDQYGYCLGAYRTRLPANLGASSVNTLLTPWKRRNIIGVKHIGLEVMHHSGTLPGFFANMMMVPSMQSAVVVLTNCQPIFDITDYATQMIMSHILEEPPSGRISSLAMIAKKSALSLHALMSDLLEKERSNKPMSLPLADYAGLYRHKSGDSYCAIKNENSHILLSFEGFVRTQFKLRPHGDNTFCWQPDYEDEVCKKGMWPFLPIHMRKIRFTVDESGCATSFFWHHDYSCKEGDVFTRVSARAGPML